MIFLAHIIRILNVPMNALGKVLLAPIAVLPGWLSNGIISVIAGVGLILLFKYTSNQTAIGLVRDKIKANMLALKLYKDSLSVTFKSQGQIFKGAGLLLFHALRPMLIMIVPVSLLLAQMGLWYQKRPLLVSEEAVVTVQLAGDVDSELPEVKIDSIEGAEILMGPIRAFSKRQVHWKIRAEADGLHNIVFEVDGESFDKQLAVGDRFMRVSVQRPGLHWEEIMLNPWEKPFGKDSTVQSISIDYSDRINRISKTSGAKWWIGYFFVVSMVGAFIFKPFLGVKI